MSRRAILIVALLTVLTMAGGVAGGILLARVDAGRREAGQAAPATTQAASPTVPTVPETSVPTTTLPATTAAPETTTAPETATAAAGPASPPAVAASANPAPPPPTPVGPPRLTARVATRLADGLVIRIDASQPLTQAVLHFGTGGKLDQIRRILGTVRHGTVTLPLSDDQIVTMQVSGRTSSGVLVRSNVFKGQRLRS